MNKRAYKKFKDNFLVTLPLAGIMSLILIIVFLILYLFDNAVSQSVAQFLISPFFGIFYLILIIFFVSLIFSLMSPFIYSYFASNTLLNTPSSDKVTIGNFLKTYVIGTRVPMKGQLRVYNNLLKAFFTYLGIFIVSALIGYSVMYGLNIDGFKDTFINFANLYDQYIVNQSQDAYNELVILLEDASFIEVITKPSLYGNFIGLFFGLYMFIHGLNIGIFRYYIANSFKGISPRAAHEIYRQSIKLCRKEFYKEYLLTLLPLIILYVILVPTLYFLGIYFLPVLKSNTYILNISIIFIIFILYMPFLPIVFNLHEHLWIEYQHHFMDSFIMLAQKEMDYMRQNAERMAEFRNMDMENLEKNLKMFKDQIDEVKKQKEEDIEKNETIKNEKKDIKNEDNNVDSDNKDEKSE